MKALIIEPSRLYQHVLSRALQDHAFETVATASSKDGMQRLNNEHFDLACISYYLDDMNGIEFCKKLRANSKIKQLPIIMITSEAKQATIREGLAVGITEIFHKANMHHLDDFLETFASQNIDHVEMSANVLYAEDSLTVAHYICKRIRAMGIEIDHFTSGEKALEAFLEKDYDLILTDLALEGQISGLALARAVRKSANNKKHVPILAISGIDDAARKVEVLKIGVNDYVTKPIIDEELKARVSNLIKGKKLLDEVEKQRRRLRDLALTDQLTSLYNRHCLADLAPKRITEAYRHNIPLSLIVMDLDHFKNINDEHGHTIGDAVLVETAKTITSVCRDEDIAARFGGEEFVLILPHCNLEQASHKAEQLRSKIAKLNLDTIKVTASFGVSSLPLETACSFEELFSTADTAVYQAKANGRNCVVTLPIKTKE